MATPLMHPAQPRLAALRQRFGATPAGRWLAAVRPTATWTIVTSVIYSGIIAVIIMGVAALVFGVKPATQSAATAGPITVGDCVSVSGGSINRAGCDGADLTFSVAETTAAATACSLPSYARIESGDRTLCLVPNLTLGDCYQVRPDSSATTDIRKIACPSGLGAGVANVIQVTERAAGAPLNCRGSASLNYAKPQRVSYCIAPVS